MYKKYKITLAIVFIIQFLGLPFVQANNTLSEGSIYTYRIVESEWDYVAGNDQSKGIGFKFEDQLFDCDESLIATVEEVDYNYVEFTVSVGSESAPYSINQMVALGFTFLLSRPFSLVYDIAYYIETEADNGLALQHMYYMPPEIFGDYFSSLSDENVIASEYPDDEDITYNDVGGSLTISSNIVNFDWVMDAHYFDESEGTDYSGTYSLSIQYDQTTGLLYGYRIDLDYAGTYEHQSVDLESHQGLELQENTKASSIPIYWCVLPLQTLSFIYLVQIIKRRKNK
ncbi:MAG: choice-of-anchor S family protein [Asgard group archaeon]|nr:choice-of-anchor S family protein [Asgard group archaeon]